MRKPGQNVSGTQNLRPPVKKPQPFGECDGCTKGSIECQSIPYVYYDAKNCFRGVCMRVLTHELKHTPQLVSLSVRQRSAKRPCLTEYNFLVPECPTTKFGERFEGITYNAISKRDVDRRGSAEARLMHVFHLHGPRGVASVGRTLI